MVENWSGHPSPNILSLFLSVETLPSLLFFNFLTFKELPCDHGETAYYSHPTIPRGRNTTQATSATFTP